MSKFQRTYAVSLDAPNLAEDPGLEPGTTESKSVVLPLHQSPKTQWQRVQESNL